MLWRRLRRIFNRPPEPAIPTPLSQPRRRGCDSEQWCNTPSTHGLFVDGAAAPYACYCGTHLDEYRLRLARTYPNWDVQARPLTIAQQFTAT